MPRGVSPRFRGSRGAGGSGARSGRSGSGDDDDGRRFDDDDDPILVHFHDIPVFVLRVSPIDDGGKSADRPRRDEEEEEEEGRGNVEEDVLYLSDVQRHNHKVCEGTLYNVTCCSRPDEYDPLSAVEVEVHPRRRSASSVDDDAADDAPGSSSDDDDEEGGRDVVDVDARQIAKQLLDAHHGSVLTVNELSVVQVNGIELICRVSRVRIDDGATAGDGTDHRPTTIAEATMADPHRGRVNVATTNCYVVPSPSLETSSSSSSAGIRIARGEKMPEGDLPPDVIHVTTADMEWFPVRASLLAPCVRLTRYVQAGKGRYVNDPIPTLSDEQRSPDAPVDDGRPHCRVSMDCCSFDRVLLFLASLLCPSEKAFALDPAEVHDLSAAADALGLVELSDLCRSQTTSFESRVRKDAYIPLREIRRRNDADRELLLVVDGMVLDVTRWIDEHPGGPSIIPTQALNVDATAFFEMYHASRSAFLYLKSFYIGELDPVDLEELRREGKDGGEAPAAAAKASDGFLQSLRSYTDKWRVMTIDVAAGEKVYKSL